jgi:hypothetical protein
MARGRRSKSGNLGTIGTIIFFILVVVGPLYAFLGDFLWILLGALATMALIAWLYGRIGDRW